MDRLAIMAPLPPPPLLPTAASVSATTGAPDTPHLHAGQIPSMSPAPALPVLCVQLSDTMNIYEGRGDHVDVLHSYIVMH